MFAAINLLVVAPGALGITIGDCNDLASPHFPELTCALLAENAAKDLVFLSFTNDHYIEMGISWAASVKAALGSNKMLLGAMSEAVFQKLKDQGVPAFRMNSRIEAGELGWGGKDFRELGRDKTRLVAQLLEMRWPSFVLTDSDVHWAANPAPYFDRYPEADVLLSADSAGSDRVKEVGPNKFEPTSLDMQKRTALISSTPLPSPNIGFLFFRSSNASRALARKWLEDVENSNVWDQQSLDNLLGRSKGAGAGTHDLLTATADGQQVTWGILPNAQFSGGEDFWVGRLHEKLQVPVYGMHADFTNWGLNGKRAKLRAAGLWHDGDAYFRGKFLAVDLTVPEELLEPYSDIDVVFDAPERHVQLVNHQLRQIAFAAAIAHGLGRVLVLPEVQCTCEYYWADRKSVV